MEQYRSIWKGYDSNINIELSSHIYGDTFDIGIIKLLCTLSKGKNIFEIGTYRGRTTHNLALNAKHVHTLDLGSNISGDGYPDYIVGEIWKNNNHSNVTQLIGNSLEFDFTPYYNKFDVVFLDGGHSYEVAKNDFLVSLKLLKPEGHLIVDDPNWPGVAKAISELGKQYNIKRIANIFYHKKQ